MMLAFEVRSLLLCTHFFFYLTQPYLPLHPTGKTQTTNNPSYNLNLDLCQHLLNLSLPRPLPHAPPSTLLSSPNLLHIDTLFTLSPAVLPNKSAAAMRLALGDNESNYFDEEVLKEREVRDQRWRCLRCWGSEVLSKKL
ncbi:hypothetical protein JAAARDRAFT_513868 [Jaapia argillacea MUCL 33604]|uniref:Uncharacterized protein n=1 Tax=Jaapia argillacea MUCL 33604 TaxID=933084 RepID=A0A067Q5W4_9AGAM|nr:hypothetical protein JAAARDRAFT_513868 [Jaapia argillacea MUCL 33604]